MKAPCVEERVAPLKKHVLVETNYCATMFEQPRHTEGPLRGRPHCTAAGRYMDTEGRVICECCAKGHIVVKLTNLPKLIALVDQLGALKVPQQPADATLREYFRTIAELATLAGQLPEKTP